jgi:hypothetical protein
MGRWTVAGGIRAIGVEGVRARWRGSKHPLAALGRGAAEGVEAAALVAIEVGEVEGRARRGGRSRGLVGWGGKGRGDLGWG